MKMTSNIFSLINDFQNRIPVDVDGLARALNIDVNYAFLQSGISGMIEKKENEKYVISINAQDPRTRQRFTLAHEVGHFIYHKDKMGDGIDDDRAYRSTNIGKYHSTRIGIKEETQANRFAANLLMPWSAIKSLQGEGIDTAEKIAEKLQVSKQAMKIRLGAPLD